jgi:RNA polymerase sigma factor (sigma-70 family)
MPPSIIRESFSRSGAVDYQKFLLEHLSLIDRVVRQVARRHHLSQADAEEFSGIVRYKLIERDFAILRRFQGRSTLSTYLTTVIERLYLDVRIARWGRWRPSAAARRLGPLAILLEQLTAREGLTFDEAVGTLQANHHLSATRDELHTIFVQLPPRLPRPAGEEEIALAAVRKGAVDNALEQDVDREIVDRVEHALAVALAALSPREQLILKLRFQDGLSAPAIGRLLNETPKALYCQLERLTRRLQEHLRTQGIDNRDVERVVGHSALTLGELLGTSRARWVRPRVR